MGGSATIDVEQAPEHVALGDFAFEELPDPPATGHAAFVRWLLGATLLALLAVGAFNWYVDATGVTGRVTKWRIAENAEVRSEKIDLYDALVDRDNAPEVVLLGSSRTMKFDPEDVRELTGAEAFNAAVSGGVPRDAWLFVQLIAERQREDFPHLVWGLDIDAFRNKELRAGLSTDPRMARFIPRTERLATMLASVGSLTELQTLEASVRSMRAGVGGRSDRSADVDRRFSASGFQRWALPFHRTAPARDRAIRSQVAQYAGFIFERDAYTEVEEAPLEEFVDAIRIANQHGDVPTIFLTPYHPLAEQLLARYELADREREVRAELRSLQASGGIDFEIVDATELRAFGGDPAQFYDGVHMTPSNTRRVLERIAAAGLLAPLEPS